MEKTLSENELRLLDKWWRAANYLSAGQLYLLRNPLLREELTMDDLGLIRRILESMDSPKSFDEKRRPKTGELTYSSVDMLMICAFVEVRKTTYGGAVTDLKDKGGQERLKALGMPCRNGEYRCPSKSTISDFINKTWPKLQKSIS